MKVAIIENAYNINLFWTGLTVMNITLWLDSREKCTMKFFQLQKVYLESCTTTIILEAYRQKHICQYFPQTMRTLWH